MLAQPFFGADLRQIEMQPDKAVTCGVGGQPLYRLVGIYGLAYAIASKGKTANQALLVCAVGAATWSGFGYLHTSE